MPDLIPETLAVRDLPPEQSRALGAWYRSVGAAVYGEDYRAAADAVAGRLDELPGAFDDALGLLADTSRTGGLLVRGVPVPADLPATPTRPFVDLRRPVGTEPVLMAAVLRLGRIVSFADWHGGDRVQNFYPLPQQATAQNANNSVHLELHTETAFRPDTPDLVALLCLRADPAVATLFCDLAQLWPQLAAGTRELLADPAFCFARPDGTTTPGRPVASLAPGGVRRFDYADAVIAADADHTAALDEFKALIDRDTAPLRLGAGDLLVLDNTRVVHGRSAIASRYDGTDRWMQRCLGGRLDPARLAYAQQTTASVR